MEKLNIDHGLHIHLQSTNRICCWTCKLYSSITVQKNSFVTTGYNSWEHLGCLYGRIDLYKTCKSLGS